MARIFIATPTHGRTVTTGYCHSLISLIQYLIQNGVGATWATRDSALLALNRDSLATDFMRNKEYTHLLFIDSDMVVSPEVAKVLLSTGKDVVGAIYPHRTFDIDQIHHYQQQGLSFQEARVAAQEFVGKAQGEFKTQNGLQLMDGIGMGFTLISRLCLETMVERGAATEYKYKSEQSKFTFFRQMQHPDGSPMEEDYSFCKRWRDIGGDVWGYPGPGVSHIGDMIFRASFADHLAALVKAQKVATERPLPRHADVGNG